MLDKANLTYFSSQKRLRNYIFDNCTGYGVLYYENND